MWLHCQAVPRTSKISVAPGGISPRPAPRAPYASSDGMTRVRFPPSCSSHSAHQHALLQTRHCTAHSHTLLGHCTTRYYLRVLIMCKAHTERLSQSSTH